MLPSPLPKPIGVVATVVATIGAVSAIFKDPLIYGAMQSFITQHPDVTVIVSAVTAIVAALAHSLTGNGGATPTPTN